jgi:hypothetical protein
MSLTIYLRKTKEEDLQDYEDYISNLKLDI